MELDEAFVPRRLLQVSQPGARFGGDLRRRRDHAIGDGLRNGQALPVADGDVGELLVAGAMQQGLDDALLRAAGDELVVGNAGDSPRKADALAADIRDFAVALVAEQQQDDRRYDQQ